MKNISFHSQMIRKYLFFCAFSVMLLAISTMFSSCDKDDVEYLFETSYTFEITIPSGQNPVQSIVFPFSNLPSRVLQEMNNRGLTADDIKRISTARARLDLLDFNGDFSDFVEAEVNVFTGLDPLLNPFEAAYTIEIRDRYSDQLDLVPSLTNLLEPLTKELVSIELVLRQRRIIPVEFPARFTITFGVEN